jgi:hypothetical protein
VKRVVHAENETNSCPRCRRHGTVLAESFPGWLSIDDRRHSVEEWEVALRAETAGSEKGSTRISYERFSCALFVTETIRTPT